MTFDRTLELPTPKHKPGAVCINREQGSVIAHIVTIQRYLGGSVGGYCEPTIEPPIDGNSQAWDRDLTQIDLTNPRSVAAEFVRQLANDQHIVNDPRALHDEIPTVHGTSLIIKIDVPRAGNGEWKVAIDGQIAASVRDDRHVSTLDQLQQELSAAAVKPTNPN